MPKVAFKEMSHLLFAALGYTPQQKKLDPKFKVNGDLVYEPWEKRKPSLENTIIDRYIICIANT